MDKKRKGSKVKNLVAMHIGDAIQELRLKRNLSLSELSSRSGVQIATLSRMENGLMTGTIEVHIEIAKTLGVQLNEIYKNIHITPKPTNYSGLR